jgi:hypothetical protein
VAQISGSLSQILSAAENLTVEHEAHDQSSEENNHTKWRKLFRLFSNVKVLRINHGLVGDLSYSVRLDDAGAHVYREWRCQ